MADAEAERGDAPVKTDKDGNPLYLFKDSDGKTYYTYEPPEDDPELDELLQDVDERIGEAEQSVLPVWAEAPFNWAHGWAYYFGGKLADLFGISDALFQQEIDDVQSDRRRQLEEAEFVEMMRRDRINATLTGHQPQAETQESMPASASAAGVGGVAVKVAQDA